MTRFFRLTRSSVIALNLVSAVLNLVVGNYLLSSMSSSFAMFLILCD